MFGGGLCTAAFVLPQELFEAGGGEVQSLSAQLHQIGVLEPGMGEAVLSGRTGPLEQKN